MNHYNDLLALGINLKRSNGSVKTKCQNVHIPEKINQMIVYR